MTPPFRAPAIQNVPRGTNLPARQDQFDQSLSPAEVERYCRLLDLEVENLTEGLVKSAWKKKLVAERDTIGRADDHDRVAELNNAKDSLLKWLAR